jgi:hypothetical protein
MKERMGEMECMFMKGLSIGGLLAASVPHLLERIFKLL